METSSSRALSGTPYGGSTIKEIHKYGDHRRMLVLADGTRRMLSKEDVKGLIKTNLSDAGRKVAEKSLRETPKGVRVKIGGAVKGTVETYKTKGAAKAAITRYYGKRKENKNRPA